MFKKLETATAGTHIDLTIALDHMKWDAQGLIPTVAQQYNTGEILMLAYMNRESLTETLQTGQVCYWSRSRQAFWRKGETSGHRQWLKEAHIDCDGDALLLQVDQTGPACHTERRSCFYHKLDKDTLTVVSSTNDT